LDGTEQLHSIGGTQVWLHLQCARFFAAEHHNTTGER